MTAMQMGVADGVGDVDRTCPACGKNDNDPRHVILGGRFEQSFATLANGQQIPVALPVDIAYHLECHSNIGCDHCTEVLDANDGSTSGKAGALKMAKGHDDLEPHEFEIGDEGVLRRVRTKTEAKKVREGLAKQARQDGE